MSRDVIIGALRRNLKRGPLPVDQQAMLAARTVLHHRHLIPARGQLDLAGRVKLFAQYVAREFGTVAYLPNIAAVPQAISAYLATQNIAPSLVVAPHAQLEQIPFHASPMLQVCYGVATAHDLVSLQLAFAGVAETGTLVLPSASTRPVKNNLLPDTAIVLLRADDILACYEDAFDRLRSEGAMPRSVMLITGPSRSADIEQTLELGAHGPRRLHVLIIDGQG